MQTVQPHPSLGSAQKDNSLSVSTDLAPGAWRHLVHIDACVEYKLACVRLLGPQLPLRVREPGANLCRNLTNICGCQHLSKVCGCQNLTPISGCQNVIQVVGCQDRCASCLGSVCESSGRIAFGRSQGVLGGCLGRVQNAFSFVESAF